MAKIIKKEIKKECVKKQCENCSKELALVNFYNTNSKISKDGKMNYCKKCIKELIDYNNMETVYNILQLADIPFYYDYWERCKEKNHDDPWGSYIRMANSGLNEFSGATYKNSVFKLIKQDANKIIEDIELKNDFKFEVTKDMIIKWGNNYKPEEYFELENFYNDMAISNNIETAQDIVYLKKLAVISLKMDKALQDGNSSEAKQLGDLFSKYMADSKFRAMDKTDADKNGGIRNFCSIYSEVEKDGFIPPWEEYRKIKGIHQDIVDKTIMHIENFTLKLNKIESMLTPPKDTPKLQDGEI